ncbi:phage Gp37/Gp68 family protein, partial [Eubacteriales bacterium OttesenSCG-928-N13]|nr:phage Gp37/Gp68 family protein [Eubacteriales bacterium OttesenSCG-928-N13]
MTAWNPWHGCHKISPGCMHCYVYRRDESVGRDASEVYKTGSFDLPTRKSRAGEYKLPLGSEVFTCGTSDFFLDEADAWRAEAWALIKSRPDCRFLIITKRIHRFECALPSGFPNGFEHLSIGCTCEDQQRADERLPIFARLPIARKLIICEPLLAPIDLRAHLSQDIAQVVVGGESGSGARECRYEWVLNLREQCLDAGVSFYFKQTGANFVRDGKRYRIPRNQQTRQARKAG